MAHEFNYEADKEQKFLAKKEHEDQTPQEKQCIRLSG